MAISSTVFQWTIALILHLILFFIIFHILSPHYCEQQMLPKIEHCRNKYYPAIANCRQKIIELEIEASAAKERFSIATQQLAQAADKIKTTERPGTTGLRRGLSPWLLSLIVILITIVGLLIVQLRHAHREMQTVRESQVHEVPVAEPNAGVAIAERGRPEHEANGEHRPEDPFINHLEITYALLN